jgi:hypothetical protein
MYSFPRSSVGTQFRDAPASQASLSRLKMENETQLPNDPNPIEPHKLRWYQYRLSSILWLMLVVALLVNNIIQWRRLQRLGITEPESDRIVKIENLGWHYRGDLPEGRWRLAVYSWNDTSEVTATEPPPNLASQICFDNIPCNRYFDIAIKETFLPYNVKYNGEAVKTVNNFTISDSRSPHSFITMSSIFSNKGSGSVATNPQPRPTSGTDGYYLWARTSDGPKFHHILARLEMVDENSLPQKYSP